MQQLSIRSTQKYEIYLRFIFDDCQRRAATLPLDNFNFLQVTAAGAVDREFVYIEGPEEAQGGPGRAQGGPKECPGRSKEAKEGSGSPGMQNRPS